MYSPQILLKAYIDIIQHLLRRTQLSINTNIDEYRFEGSKTKDQA